MPVDIWFEVTLGKRRPDPGPREKAKATLLRMLNPEQRETYLNEQYFLVTGSEGNIYRINTNSSASGNVLWVILPDSPKVYRPLHDTFGPKQQSMVIGGKFCAYPGDFNLPREDMFLGQMLHLITAENDYLRTSYLQLGGWPPSYSRANPHVSAPRVMCECRFCVAGRQQLERIAVLGW